VLLRFTYTRTITLTGGWISRRATAGNCRYYTHLTSKPTRPSKHSNDRQRWGAVCTKDPKRSYYSKSSRTICAWHMLFPVVLTGYKKTDYAKNSATLYRSLPPSKTRFQYWSAFQRLIRSHKQQLSSLLLANSIRRLTTPRWNSISLATHVSLFGLWIVSLGILRFHDLSATKTQRWFTANPIVPIVWKRSWLWKRDCKKIDCFE